MMMDILFILLVAALLYYHIVTDRKRREREEKSGERLVSKEIKLHFPRQSYFLIDDVTLPAPDGGTLQIDHIVVSLHGVFIIETNNRSGQIFGGKNNRQWVQSFPREKYNFQNPLHDNFKKINDIANMFGVLDKKLFKSIIVFTNSMSELKSDRINNVIHLYELKDYIRSFREHEMTLNQLYYIVGKIEVIRKKTSKQPDELPKLKLQKRFANFTSLYGSRN